MIEFVVICSAAARESCYNLPVADFAPARTLFANNGYFRNGGEHDGAGASYGAAFRGVGNHIATVALLGAGTTARILIGLLQPFRLRVLVYDSFLTV